MASSSSKKEKNIQVYVRCRPLNNSEKKALSPSVVDVNPQNREVIVKERLGDKELSKKFTFDRVFGPESAQIDVYNTVVSGLIEEVLMGYNCTVFAYGQTGTGKTHTMIGSKSSPNLTWEEDPLSGIIPRTLNNLYDALNQLEVEFNVRVSFLELYNEELYDLLAPVPDGSKLRMLKDNGKMGAGTIWVQGLEEKMVHNKEEVYGILEKGTDRRRVGSTLMNDQSSRSHTVFTITIHIKENNIDGEDLLKIGKLNLVDLAGSECIGRSGAVERRAREAGSINQSLLTLGRVITALVERAPHVPYRESKLTRLLQDSLGGRTKTSIIATISPALVNIEETLSTLDYAHRARNIMNKPEVNQKLTKKAVMKEYIEEIDRLRRDLVASRDKNGMFIDVENYEFMQNKISGLSTEVKDKFTQIEALKEQLLLVEERFTVTKSELCQKERQLNYTTNQLSRTETQLQDTISTLKVAVCERDEQKYLVNHRVKTETLLTEQAKELINVIGETTNHVEGLHSKIERKKLVENINLEKTELLQSTFHKNLTNLEIAVDEAFDRHDILTQELEDELAANVLKQGQLTVENMIMLQELRDFMTNNSLITSQHVYDSESLAQKWTERNTEINDKFIQAITSEQETFHNQKAQVLLNKLSRLILNQNKLIEEQNELFKQKVQFSSSNLQTNLVTIKSQIGQLRLYEGKISQEQAQEMNKIRDNQQHLEKDRENLLSKWETQKELVTDIFLKALKETDKIIHDHSSALNTKLSEDIQSATKFQELDLQRSQKLAEELDQISLAMTDMVTKSLQSTQDASDYHFHLTKKIESDLLELNSTVSMADESFATNLTSMKKSLEDLKQFFVCEAAILNKETLDNKTAILTSLMNLTTQFEDKSKRLIELSTTSKDSLETSTANQNRVHNIMDEWSGQFQQLLHSELNNYNTAVEKFVNEEFVKDVPTGQTPVRKDYVYPQELVQTSPHNQILRKLRQQVSLESGVKFNLPEENDSEVVAVSPMKQEESPNTRNNLRQASSQLSINYGSSQDLSASVESNISEGSINQNVKENKVNSVKPMTASKLKAPTITKAGQRKILSSRNTTPITSSPKLKRK